jgi:large subunit ribosomal protein L22
MQFIAKARYVHYSPYKLRPLADVVRGKNVTMALNWLVASATRRTNPLKKVLESAAANAKNLNNVEPTGLVIKDIRVDEGPRYQYFKPGAMGRANPQTRRFCHISIILEPIAKKEV